MIKRNVHRAGESVIDYLAKTDESQHGWGSTQRRLGHDPNDRIASQVILQLGRDLLHHQAGHRAGNIDLCAQEPTRQALINMMVACRDVARMVNCSVALVTIDSPGEIVDGMHMKRSKQHHRHIYRQ